MVKKHYTNQTFARRHIVHFLVLIQFFHSFDPGRPAFKLLSLKLVQNIAIVDPEYRDIAIVDPEYRDSRPRI
jgi:hypothetical protein